MIVLRNVLSLLGPRSASGAFSAVCVSTRGIRQRRCKEKNRNEVADFVADATTYVDRHAIILDPHSTLPYDIDELQNNYLNRGHLTRKQLALMKAKMKFNKRVLLNLNFNHIPVHEQVALMFPGQGAQHVGMGSKVLDHPCSLRLFEQASEILGYDLADVCKNGPKSELDQTIFCQPAIFVSSMAALEKMKNDDPGLAARITAAAGFSIGEFCALVAGDVISFQDAVKVIKIRAEVMHECCQLVPSGMMTVRTTASSRLDEAMKQARKISAMAGEKGICDIANYLYCGVKVIGASEAALNYLEHNCGQHEFQVIKRLPVAGAFHTSLMKPAAAKLMEALIEIPVKAPRINVYSNFTGKVYWRTEGSIRKCITKQVYAPVKWEQIVQLLFHMHKKDDFPSYVEVGPGRQLGAILRQVSKKAHANYNNYPC